MAQRTDLKVSEVEIIPSRQMEAAAYFVGNESIHDMAKPISKLLFYFPKSDSNNSATVCNPQDTQQVKKQVAWYLKIKQSIKDAVGGPEPVSELELAIVYPADIELQKLFNECTEQVAKAFYRHLKVLVSIDERGMKSFISPKSFAKIEASEAVLFAKIKTFLEDPDDVGPAELAELGNLNPDPDFNYVRRRESSPDAPRVGHEDALDTPVG